MEAVALVKVTMEDRAEVLADARVTPEGHHWIPTRDSLGEPRQITAPLPLVAVVVVVLDLRDSQFRCQLERTAGRVEPDPTALWLPEYFQRVVRVVRQLQVCPVRMDLPIVAMADKVPVQHKPVL